ncbi:MAG: hypothetical protein C7B45_04690 [Sulfobacillus acidophilus]|uniref:AMP-dependent ligase C-terminal domain-containing protein n=1 Tax=Sulfobacillus acidophilus TaxID=53633 RepID=A0A2T2WL06_9FIRM|nr:MAG: hypothetical protein C7B45_04690 [Sulfobacillus acidophilus]
MKGAFAMKSYWDQTIQTMRPEEVRERQLKLLRRQIQYVYDRAPFYRDLYDRHGLKPHQIQTWDDFRKRVPVFHKDDLRDYQKRTGDPFSGLLCVPRSQLVGLWTSSGTTGLPTLGAYTRTDMATAIEYMTRSYWDAGVRPGQRAFLININFHWLMPLTWGMSRRLGLRPLLFDFGHAMMAERIAQWILDYRPDVIPSITTELATLVPVALRKMGYDPAGVLQDVKMITTMGEALTDTARSNLQLEWGGVTVRDGAGCGEGYVWMFEGSCEHPGAHYWGDIGYVEVLDPDTGEITGEPVGRGELVASNLLVQGVPYVRFGTEDYVEIYDDHCERMGHPYGRILGRSNWRVRVRGEDFLPYDVENVIQRYPETRKAEFFITREAEMQDTLTVSIAYDRDLTRDPDKLLQSLSHALENELRVPVAITWVQPSEIPRPVPHKLQKFVDRSKNH